MFGKTRNQRWLTLTRSRYEITYISASIHDINKIPTAVPIDVKYVDPKNKKRKKDVFYEKNKIRKKT